MATFEMALVEGGPKRLEVRRPVFTKRHEIWLDGQDIGRIDETAVAIAGRVFPLPPSRGPRRA